MKTEKLVIGDTLHIFAGNVETAKQEIIEKGLNDGHSVIVEGVKTWRRWDAIVDLSKQGSDQYIWDASGNRIKGNLVEFTKNDDGTSTQQIIKTSYRNEEQAQ